MENQVHNQTARTVNAAVRIASTSGGAAPGAGGASSSSSGQAAPTLSQSPTQGLPEAPSGAQPITIDDPQNGGGGIVDDNGQTTPAERSVFQFILGEDELGGTDAYLAVQGNDIEYSF